MNHDVSREAGDRRRKRIFLLLAAAGFAAILLFNLLTPMISDDLAYGYRVKQAQSFADLLRQESEQYHTWTGRSVAHLILRIFLSGSKKVFAVCNSVVFMCLSFLMYRRIRGRKQYDAAVFALIQTAMWIFGVEFAQTCLWETGSCNYLWTTTIILFFMDRMEACAEHPGGLKDSPVRKVLRVIGLFLLGTAAGWCNENTSGGALLFSLYLLYTGTRRQNTEGTAKKRQRPDPAVLAGTLGNAFGLFMMVRAPGNFLRSSYIEENYSGILGIVARITKVTQIIGEKFYVLILVLIITCIVSILQKDAAHLKNRLLYGFLFIMTSYALILAGGAQARAYFGAGAFLIIACVQGIKECVLKETAAAEEAGAAHTAAAGGYICRAAACSVLAAMVLYMFFTYMDCGADLARIWRDTSERTSILEDASAAGLEYVEVRQLHPEFDNRYTAAFSGGSEMQEDPGYWINVEFEAYYGIPEISALPPESEADSGNR